MRVDSSLNKISAYMCCINTNIYKLDNSGTPSLRNLFFAKSPNVYFFTEYIAKYPTIKINKGILNKLKKSVNKWRELLKLFGLGFITQGIENINPT